MNHLLYKIGARLINEKNENREWDAALNGKKLNLPRVNFEKPKPIERSDEDNEKLDRAMAIAMQRKRLEHGN